MRIEPNYSDDPWLAICQVFGPFQVWLATLDDTYNTSTLFQSVKLP